MNDFLDSNEYLDSINRSPEDTRDLLATLTAAHDQYNGIARETATTVRTYWRGLVEGGMDTNSALSLTIHYQDRLLRMIMPSADDNPNEED